jgi:hypothetical protein
MVVLISKEYELMLASAGGGGKWPDPITHFPVQN